MPSFFCTMRYAMLMGWLTLAIRLVAQDSLAIGQPLQHLGIFAGAGYSWLSLKAGAPVAPDSGQAPGTLTAVSAPGMSAGVFLTIPAGKLEWRPSVTASVYPLSLTYDFDRPVTEKYAVHPFSAGVGLDVTRGLGAANQGAVRRFSPLAGMEYLYAVPLFDGSRPEKKPDALRFRLGAGLKTRHTSAEGRIQRSHLEMVLSWQLNNIARDADDRYTAPVDRLMRHTVEFRYYFQ